MSLKIRRYQEADIPRCLDGIEDFLNEDRGVEGYVNHHKSIDFDREKMYKRLRIGLNDLDFFCNLIEKDGEVVGGLCAVAAEPIYSSQRIAYDQLLYSVPSFKNLRAVLTLIKTYVDWAHKRGLYECRLCNSTGFNQEGFTKLCHMAGFEQFEVGFVRRF